MLVKTFTFVNNCVISDIKQCTPLLLYSIMKAYEKAKKLKISSEADNHQARSDGLRILAKIIARAYGNQSLPQETKTAITSDNSVNDQQTAENQRDFLQ